MKHNTCNIIDCDKSDSDKEPHEKCDHDTINNYDFETCADNFYKTLDEIHN